MMRGLLTAVALLFVIDSFGYTLLLTTDSRACRSTANMINRVIISTWGEKNYEACVNAIRQDTSIRFDRLIYAASYNKSGIYELRFLDDSLIARTLGDPDYKQKLMKNVNCLVDTAYGYLEGCCVIDTNENRIYQMERSLNSIDRNIDRSFYIRGVVPRQWIKSDMADDYHIDFKRIWQEIDSIDKVQIEYFK